MSDDKSEKMIPSRVLKNFALNRNGLKQFKRDDLREAQEARMAAQENREPNPIPAVMLTEEEFFDLNEVGAVKRLRPEKRKRPKVKDAE